MLQIHYACLLTWVHLYNHGSWLLCKHVHNGNTTEYHLVQDSCCCAVTRKLQSLRSLCNLISRYTDALHVTSARVSAD